MQAGAYVVVKSGCLKRICFDQLRCQQDLVRNVQETLPGRVRIPCGVPVHSLSLSLPAGSVFFVSLGEKLTPCGGRFGTLGSGVADRRSVVLVSCSRDRPLPGKQKIGSERVLW